MFHKILHIRAKGFILYFLLQLSFSGIHAQTEELEDTTTYSSDEYFDSLGNSNNEQISVRQVPIARWKQLKADDAFWYADQAPERKKESSDTGDILISPAWFKTLIWFIIIITMIGVLLWFLASSDIRLFRKSSTVIADDESPKITEDIFAVDYEKEIWKARNEQNFRLAIRLFFLRTLKELSDNGIIEYKHEKTNREYLQQLSGTNYYSDFFKLTREFEYAWYGKVPISSAAFDQVQHEFLQFKQRMPT